MYVSKLYTSLLKANRLFVDASTLRVWRCKNKYPITDGEIGQGGNCRSRREQPVGVS